LVFAGHDDPVAFRNIFDQAVEVRGKEFSPESFRGWKSEDRSQKAEAEVVA